MNPKEVVLVYFEGCPNAKRARELLIKSGVSFRAVDQGTLSAGDSLRGFSSPSVLVDGELIFGATTQNQSLGCTVTPLDEKKFLVVLRQTLLQKGG